MNEINIEQYIPYMELSVIIKELEKKMPGEKVAKELTKVLDGKRLLVYRKVGDGHVEWVSEMNGSIGNYYEVEYMEFDDPGYSVKFINNHLWYPVEGLLVEKSIIHDGFVQEVSKNESNIDLSGHIRLTEVIEKLESNVNDILAVERILNGALYQKEVFIDMKCDFYRGNVIPWVPTMDRLLGDTSTVLAVCASQGEHLYVRVKLGADDSSYISYAMILPPSILVKKSDVSHLWASKSNEPKTLADLVALPGLERNNGAKLYDATNKKAGHIWKPLIGTHVKITRGSNDVSWVPPMDDTVGKFVEVKALDYAAGMLRLGVGKWYYTLDSICLSLGIVKRLDIKLTSQIIGMLGLSSDHIVELYNAISTVETATYNLNNSIDRIIETVELERRSDEKERVYATPTDIKDYLGKGHTFHPVYNNDILMYVIVEPVAVSFDGKRIIGKDGKRYTKLLVI